MSVKRYDFDCYEFYDSARLNVQECDDGDYVLHSDYAALLDEIAQRQETEDSLARWVHDLGVKYDALRDAVAWEREAETAWYSDSLPLTARALHELHENFTAARAEVDRLIADAEGHAE